MIRRLCDVKSRRNSATSSPTSSDGFGNKRSSMSIKTPMKFFRQTESMPHLIKYNYLDDVPMAEK